MNKKTWLNSLILGCLISASANVAQAATLTATPTPTNDFFSSFTIEFDDANNNGILDSNEISLPLGQPDFSGVTTTSSIFYTQVTEIANITGITQGFSFDVWVFPNPNGIGSSVQQASLWNYEITGDNIIPEPLTILGTGLVAGFLPLLKRQKKS
ncbi:MAG: PEP-CTERM sorting domain-containing protein [Gloeocapsa sp. DLM2.Bin57]|nr:MAG: PEP-CTERM sorting domain-containing protein [Gloeocapsa sp. DLM2.Bin57]